MRKTFGHTDPGCVPSWFSSTRNKVGTMNSIERPLFLNQFREYTEKENELSAASTQEHPM